MNEKIYITALHLQHGGVEMAISLLSNALVRRGYSVDILCVYNLGKPAYAIDPKVNIQYLTNVYPNRGEFLKAKNQHNIIEMLKQGCYSLKVLFLKNRCIKNVISKIDKGIIISTRNEHSIILSKYGQEKVYKIAQLHHDHAFEKKYVDTFRRKYNNIDKFVLLTEELKIEVEDIFKGYNDKTKCVVIPNFLENVKRNVKLEEKEKVVITVGRLHPVKGFERLLEIWSMIQRQNSEWKLKIVGGGELQKKLHDEIVRLNLESSVQLMGELNHEKVMQEMNKASFYVMTSYSEAFPFVLIEAMSNGLPVIAFDVRVGPRAIIKNDKDGFLIKDNDLVAFADKMQLLINEEEIRIKMGEKAIEKAFDFSEEVVIEKWTALFEEK